MSWALTRTKRGLRRRFPAGPGALMAVVLLVALAGCSLFSAGTPAPTPPAVATRTPEQPPANSPPVQLRPTPTSSAVLLGPAPVTDTTHLHEPFAKEQCGTCHDLTNKQDPTQLWGPVVEVCRVCHWQEIDSPQPTYIHDPFPEGDCLTCHAPHASREAFLLRTSQAQVCRQCHEEPAQQPHPTIASEECLLCHAGHGSEQQAILREPEARLCARCHADHTQEGAAFVAHAREAQDCTLCHEPHSGSFQSTVVSKGCSECHEHEVVSVPPVFHAPVMDDECLTCHVFHQEEQFALLAKPQPAICRDCHPLGEPVEQTHPSIAAGECLLCHSGHGGEHLALLRKDGRALCATCHEEKVVAVQTSVRPHFESSDLPLCANCHDPHTGTQDAIELTESCARCHTDQSPLIAALREASPGIHAPLREEGCVACHGFHALEAGHPTGNALANNLCLECHADLEHEAHPVAGRLDPWHGGQLSCVSCHSPHDTPFRANLLVAGDALCLQCHKFGP